MQGDLHNCKRAAHCRFAGSNQVGVLATQAAIPANAATESLRDHYICSITTCNTTWEAAESHRTPVVALVYTLLSCMQCTTPMYKATITAKLSTAAVQYGTQGCCDREHKLSLGMPVEAPFPRGAGAAASTKSTAADDSRSKKAGSKRAAPDDAADYLFGTRPAPKDKKARTTEGGVKGDMGIRAARAAAEVGAGMVLEQKGRPSKLELVSFKKLTKGTLLLGVVMRVGSDDLIVALPSSLTGIVRRADVSDQLHSITATDDAAPPNSRRTKR
eukprot:17354-Heterococcus_DN1.PRE.2